MLDLSKDRKPSFGQALTVLLGIISILIVGILGFGLDIHVLLILGLILTCFVAIRVGFSFDELVDAMKDGLGKAMSAILIFILIGMIIGSWIQAGTVPALIYYGLKFLSPKFFLPAGLIVCSITSFATGTSWGTAGTVGLALMGMGMGLGIPAPAIAGMVVSGAFFGDKMSPLSDTTILAAASADCDMYDHIGAMMYTMVPTYIISLIIYTFLGFKYSSSNAMASAEVAQLQEVLVAKFNLNPIVILPIIVVLILSFMKVSSVPALTLGTFLGTAIAIIFQGSSVKAALAALNYGYTEATGIFMVDKLLIRGGIQGMMWTFSLAIVALCLGGVLEKTGFLTVLIEKILTKINSAANLITVSLISAIIGNAAMSEIYLSIILNGSLYRDAYEARGLKKCMLSRVLEEGATMTGALIPWTTCGAFISGALGVSAIEYMPFALLNIINPIMTIVLSYLGIFVLYENGKPQAAQATK